ncbi:hypothetical protein VDGL01_11994 [Verticillium dahliae]
MSTPHNDRAQTTHIDTSNATAQTGDLAPVACDKICNVPQRRVARQKGVISREKQAPGTRHATIDATQLTFLFRLWKQGLIIQTMNTRIAQYNETKSCSTWHQPSTRHVAGWRAETRLGAAERWWEASESPVGRCSLVVAAQEPGRGRVWQLDAVSLASWIGRRQDGPFAHALLARVCSVSPTVPQLGESFGLGFLQLSRAALVEMLNAVARYHALAARWLDMARRHWLTSVRRSREHRPLRPRDPLPLRLQTSK